MWADNEADLDLLGFDFLVDGLVVAMTEPRLLPLTVGVLGDWGSGKSSLMHLAGIELAAMTKPQAVGGEEPPQPRYLIIEFSPWQHEDYDDVKVALMATILDALEDAAPELSAEIDGLRRLIEGFKRLGRRIGRFSAAVAPAATPLVLQILAPHLDPAAGDLAKKGVEVAAEALAAQLTEPSPPSGSEVDVAQPERTNDVKTFREQFGDLVSKAPFEAVVVLIDDLDRCLPETVVDTFEAIRLFLNTPKTAYALALNQSVVEAAIDSRYPELKKADNAGIGRDYLEKMLQLKVAIPALSAPEAETYINLLFAELHLADEDFDKVLTAAAEVRATGELTVAFNAGIAMEALGSVPEALVADLAWAGEVTPILATSLRGNPRQLKRFLNNLLLKHRSAAKRNITLELPILAKLLVLEDQYRTEFQRLFDWEMAAGGRCRELAEAEDHARGVKPEILTSGNGEKDSEVDVASATAPPSSDVTAWADKVYIGEWLRTDPRMQGVDLRPYFTYSRDKLSFGVSGSRLTPELQQLLTQIQSDVEASRRSHYAEVTQLDASDRAQLMEALVERVQRHPGGTALTAALELAEHHGDVVSVVCGALKRVPPSNIPAQAGTIAVRRLPAQNGEVLELLEIWEQSENVALKGTVKAARKAQSRKAAGGNLSR